MSATMNKPYGAQGEILNFPFKDLQETFYDQDGIELTVDGGVLSVGVDDRHTLEEAKELAQLYLAAWTVRQDIKVQVTFNHVWEPNQQGGQHHSLTLEDRVRAVDRVQVHVTTHRIQLPLTYTVVSQQMRDSASFTGDAPMLQKAQRYAALKSALLYYSQEVVDDDRPLYGVYKALEAMIDHLAQNQSDGRRALARLAGQPRSYVDDVMQTAQVRRHHRTTGTRRLTDEECRQRAKLLIDTFARSLP